MAFLLPVAAAAGGAVLGNLMNKVVNKIVGDAPVPDSAVALIDGMMNDIPATKTWLMTNPIGLNQGELETIQNSPEFLYRSALMQTRGQLGALMNLPNQSVPAQNALLAARNQLNQTTADAAAVKQMVQQTNPMITATNASNLLPGMAVNPDLLASQLQSTPVSMNYLNSSLNNSNVNNNQLLQQYQASQNLPQTNSQARLQQLQSQIPTQINSQASSSLTQAAQPLFKTITNQEVLTPSTQNYNMNANPGSVADTAKAVAGAVGNTFMGTAAQAAKAGIISGGEQLAVSGANALTKVISKAATGFGGFLAKGLSGLVSKIVGDASVPMFDVSQSQVPLDIDVRGSRNPLSSRGLENQVRNAIGEARGLHLLGGPDTVPDFLRNPKIVGDAQVPKIVGDAPPSTAVLPGQGETMTEDQMTVAMDNLNLSGSFNLLSQLLLEEQVEQLATGLPNGLNVIEMNRNLGSLIETRGATFQQAQVNTALGMQGAPMGHFNAFLTVEATGVVDSHASATGSNVNYITNDEGVLGVHHHRVYAPKAAPPMGGNITLDTLKPLLLGAALTEYSSQLRIRTSVVNVDEMLKAVAMTSHNLEGQTGYSFATPLIKIMGYLLTRYPVLGENQLAYSNSGNITFNANGDGGGTSLRSFPFEIQQIGTEQLRITAITEQTFISTMSGNINTTGWVDIFKPANWGSTCAIVHIQVQDAGNGLMNFVEMLSELAYPIALDTPNNMAYYEYLRAPVGGGAIINGQEPVLHSQNLGVTDLPFWNTTLNRIEGPFKAVMFVVSGTTSLNQNVDVSVGPPNVAGQVTTVNTVDEGPTQPVAIDMAGDEMNIWLTWLTSNNCITTLMAWMRRWESSYGNNSDRSTAMRFWGDFSRRWGPNAIGSNSLHQGGVQGFGGFSRRSLYVVNGDMPAFPQMLDWPATDTPAWALNSTQIIHPLDAVGLTYLIKSATGLTPELWQYTRLTKNMTQTSRDNVVTILPATDFMVNYLTKKQWIYPQEEYPVAKLDDPARVAVTIGVMNNIMASLSDLLCQSSDITHPEFYCPGVIVQDQVIRMRYEKYQSIALNEIFSSGIQFPTMQYQRTSDVDGSWIPTINVPELNSNPLVLYVSGYGNGLLGMSALASVARIPRQLMSDWSPVFLPMQNKLRLNFPACNPSRRLKTVGTERLAMFQVWINQDQTKLNNPENTILGRYLSRLSQGVVMSGTSPNPSWLVYNNVETELKVYLVGIRWANEARDTMINYSCGRGVLNLPNLTSLGLPKVENLITRDPVQGYSPLTLTMVGPTDSFGPGDGSYDYDMFYVMSGGYAAITTNVYTLVPESIFSGSAMQNLFSNI